ncbi:MAG: site-specific integrase [Chitinophagaceae bacterium]
MTENKIVISNLKLHDFGGDMKKEWYVGFSYNHPETHVRTHVQVRMKLNWHKTRTLRYTAGKAISKIITESIEAGWLPYRQSIKEFLQENENEKAESKRDSIDLTFSEAMKFALEKGKWSVKTKLDYSNTAKLYSDACSVLKLHKKAIHEFTKRDILVIGEHLLKTRHTWSNYSYNKNRAYLCALFSILEEWEIVENNVVKKVKTLPVAESSRKYEPLTVEEKKRIQEHLYLTHYSYFVYLMAIYHTGIRPKEVLMIQIKDVDLVSREVRIVPDIKKGNSKTKKIRYVPVNDELYTFLREMKLECFPSTYYVFGSTADPNDRRRPPATDQRYFRPQPYPMLRDTATKLWNMLIISPKTGLGIKKHQYAMKHTGADDKILAGVSLEALRSMYGHSSSQMTERYITQLREINKRLIIEKSPSFISDK